MTPRDCILQNNEQFSSNGAKDRLLCYHRAPDWTASSRAVTATDFGNGRGWEATARNDTVNRCIISARHHALIPKTNNEPKPKPKPRQCFSTDRAQPKGSVNCFLVAYLRRYDFDDSSPAVKGKRELQALWRHSTLGTSPAVAAKLTDHVWTVEELLANISLPPTSIPFDPATN